MKLSRDEKIECACGCGQLRCKYDIQGIERKYIWGHKNMFKKGHKEGFQKGNKLWNNQNSKKTQFKKGVKQSEEFIKKRFDNRRKMGWFKNRNLTVKRLRESKLKEKNPMYNKKGKLHHFYGGHHKEESKKKIRKARANQILPFKDTKIEVKIQNFLKLLHIEFINHYYLSSITHKYRCDIFIPSRKLVIEADGCYWHGCKICNKKINQFQLEQIEEDNIRTRELISKGFKIIRLWEHDINNMNLKKFENKIRSFI